MHNAYLIEAYHPTDDGTNEGGFYIRTDATGLVMQPTEMKGPDIYTTLEEAMETIQALYARQEAQPDLVSDWYFRPIHAKLPMEFVTIKTSFVIPSVNLDWDRILDFMEGTGK